MRRADLEGLKTPYKDPKQEIDRRFASAIGADTPHAREITSLIFNSLDKTNFGLPQLSTLPIHERILVSDYLYQCATSIETNLIEGKLHYMEWLDYVEQHGKRLSDLARNNNKMPKSEAPIDDLPGELEKLHVGGFFRAIGSALDCLGATIAGVLGLSVRLRKADITNVREKLRKLKDDGSSGTKIQIQFAAFLEDAIIHAGPNDWLVWSTQYRHMFVHRGRRQSVGNLVESDILLFGPNQRPIPPRLEMYPHLSNQPDRTDAEAMVKSRTVILNENAQVTLTGILASTRQLIDDACEELVKIWKQRSANHLLINQPLDQWNDMPKACTFRGYDPSIPAPSINVLMGHPIFVRRLQAAALMDQQRGLWSGTVWVK